MTFGDIFRIFRKHLMLLILFPVAVASLVYMKTRKREKEYASTCLIYTGVASGYNVTTEEHPRLDHNAVSNAFDNLLNTLKSRETVQEVSLRLVASHITLDKPDLRYISPEKYNEIRAIVPDSVLRQVKGATPETTYEKMQAYIGKNKFNVFSALVASQNGIYGVDKIRGRVNAIRKENSDMLDVSYSANDAAICQQTLLLLAQVFIRKFSEIKESEVKNVVSYYADQTDKARARLNDAELKLKDFQVKNKIINFDEQAKVLSESKQTYADEIEREKMILASAQASLASLEERLKGRKNIMESNDRVLAKQELSDINYKLANAKNFGETKENLKELTEKAEAIKKELKDLVNNLYSINNSQEGIPSDNILQQWLSNVLIVEESGARLKIMQERYNSFNSTYNDFTPLGSLLLTLKREVQVAEKEYMNKLEALNMNQQRYQNVKMSSNIKLLDQPFYPVKPIASKDFVLIPLSMIASFLLLISIYLAMELLDSSVKNPSRAERLTGFEIAGVLPKATQRNRITEYFEDSLIEQAVNRIVLETEKTALEKKPKIVLVAGTQISEGKTWMIYKMAKRISDLGYISEIFTPGSEKGYRPESIDKREVVDISKVKIRHYEIIERMVPAAKINEILKTIDKADFVFLEIPSLQEYQLPLQLVKEADLCLLVLRADRPWKDSDNYLSSLLTKVLKSKPLLVLNKVTTDRLIQIYGKVPKWFSAKLVSKNDLDKNVTKKNKVSYDPE
jgi:succinoglycan biosynthesis transport protein ExoP